MRWLTTGAALVMAALLFPMAASGYSFGDWALEHGYSPGAVMPEGVDASGFDSIGPIDSLSGIDAYDWTTTPTMTLYLSYNQLSSIEAGTFRGLANLHALFLEQNQLSTIEPGGFDGLTNLAWLYLGDNQLSSIEAGDFGGLTNLQSLSLGHNQLSSIEPGTFRGLSNLGKLGLGNNPALTELNLTEANFSSLDYFDVHGNTNITTVSLNSTVLIQDSLAALMNGGVIFTGIGELPGITEMDLSGVDFVNITDLAPLNVMDDLTDLWLVETQNLDATALDLLLDELDTIQGTDIEGILHMTQADFVAFNTAGSGLLAAWNAEPGHHVDFVLPGDFNGDGTVNAADYTTWRDAITAGSTTLPNDPTPGAVDESDFLYWRDHFGETLGSGAGAASSVGVPEPNTALLFCLGALGVAALHRRHRTR